MKTLTYTWCHKRHEHNKAIYLKYNLVQIYKNGKMMLLKKC